ncbi:hypothetical protein ACTM7X_22010 [Citrobacter braakii]|uniref:hypothetical protein n=1 Tax=Enterobacteriaceae TaxID=543 RepID=UPI000B8E7C89|nr:MULTISPECIES: hypothetical protein [Enterobacteriaceae]MCW1435887.1 hypothetical protein [Citrobacter freundii]EMB9957219.1 hypothetical protein [Escherichia coli]MBA8128402.1 hypothetical protein [Citrobacter sp. RHBSTW-00013]MCD9261532.1 hypothetical protein [Citrobacter braakii]MCW1447411.1 hypothetical protein [Citrobacter freundii]
MTSILEKIGKAIDCSRRTSDLVITEDQQTTTRKLFISGTMDNDTLQLWGEVMDTDAENLRITFVDDSRDDIRPAQGIPGQKHFITIISDELPGILRLFTLEGWRSFLLQDPRLCQYHRIYALFINEAFETQQWKVAPWKKMLPDESESDVPTQTASVTKSIIRCFSTDFLPPDTIAPWILISGDTVIDESMRLWESLACRELLKCFVNELFAAEIKKVGLSGKPPRKIPFGEEHAALPAFDVIQETAKWIFLEGNETELKHTFLSSELAREWPEGVTFCEGIVYRLSPALESARLLYKAHIRTGGKDTLKSLGDLRKSLTEDTQKILQQSRGLSSTLWKDMALVISTLILRYSLEALKASGPQKVYALAFCALALYIAISYGMSVYINRNALSLLEQNRITWRSKLYGFLDEQDYQELAGLPINTAMWSYRRVERITSAIMLVLVTLLLTAAASEFWSLSMIMHSGYTWVMSALQFLTSTALRGPNDFQCVLQG